MNLNGTVWFNQGTATVLTAGCQDEAPQTMLESCAEDWNLSQDGNKLDIIVDEYRLNGRLCGDKLYLEGGWWLSVEDEGRCNYDDGDGDEFGIQAEGNVLTFVPANPDSGGRDQFEGTLILAGACGVSYEMTLMEAYSPPSS